MLFIYCQVTSGHEKETLTLLKITSNNFTSVSISIGKNSTNLNAIGELSTVEEVGPAGGVVQHKSRR